MTDFTIPSYANVSTLRIENTPIIDTLAVVNAIQPNSRVRLIGVDWSFDTASEVIEIMNKFDTFRGLDENGNNIDKAVVSGVIHIPSLTGAELAELNARYPNITIDYDALSVYVRFYNGETLVNEQLVASGTAIAIPSDPTKESTAQYHYPFKGWSIDGENVVEVGVAGNADVNYYAVFEAELRYYTVRFINGTKVEQTSTIPYGGSATPPADPTWSGEEPENWAFTGWKPDGTNITADTDCIAQFKSTLIISDRLVEKALSGAYYNDRITSVGYGGLSYLPTTSIELPNVTTLGMNAIYYCGNLKKAILPSVTLINSNGLANLYSLEFLDICGGNRFPGMSTVPNLKTLIIRKTDAICPLSDITDMSSSIRNGNGYIYVPAALIDAYVEHSVWSQLASQFRAIEDYPDITGGGN